MQLVKKQLSSGYPVLRARPWVSRTRPQFRHSPRWTASSRRRIYAGASAEQAPVETATPSVVSSRYGDLVWASCVSSQSSITAAVTEAVDHIEQQQPDGFEPSLAIIFASCNYGSQLQDVVKTIRRQVPSVRHIFGCSAFGVLGGSAGGSVEIEGEPGISLTLAALPGVEVSVMHTLRSSIPSEDASPESWADLVGMSPLEQLQQSTAPSAAATAADEEDEDEHDEEEAEEDVAAAAAEDGDAQQQQQQQRSRGHVSADKGSSEVQLKPESWISTGASGQQQQQQQQQQPSEAVSFLVLCDPRFQQSKQLLAGLDFAFPNSNKVGAVLSQGQQNKRRLMFVWSADGSVQTGTAAWKRKQQHRRQKQQQQLAASSHNSTLEQQQQQQRLAESATAATQDLEQQQQQQQSQQQSQQSVEDSGNDKKKGLFGTLFDSLLSGLNEEEQQQQQQQWASSSGAQDSRALPADIDVVRRKGGSDGDEGNEAHHDRNDHDHDDDRDHDHDDDLEADEDAEDAAGVFMYGAAVLSMKGPLVLEPVTCQGYRTVSDKVWTIGQTSRDGDLIATLIDPDPDSDDDDDRDDQEPGGDGESEVVPLIAVYELIMSAGFDEEKLGDSPEEWIENLSSSLAVAIAPDSFRPISELQQDDFQVCAISEVWQKTGYIRVDGQARPGYRLRLVLRDELGIRDDLSNKLLGLKRAELAGVLTGKKQPPALGALLISDIGRGTSLYDSPSYESGAVSKFLPAPLSGLFGSAQISTVNKKAALYELASVIGIMRPLVNTSGTDTGSTVSSSTVSSSTGGNEEAVSGNQD